MYMSFLLLQNKCIWIQSVVYLCDGSESMPVLLYGIYIIRTHSYCALVWHMFQCVEEACSFGMGWQCTSMSCTMFFNAAHHDTELDHSCKNGALKVACWVGCFVIQTEWHHTYLCQLRSKS